MSSDWMLPGAAQDPQTLTAEWLPHDQPLIDGVRVREVRNVLKGTGQLTEVYRRDWQLDDAAVDQVFQVVLLPGRISAWHAHAHTLDRLFVAEGQARIVLYDARSGSPTQGLVNEFKVGEHRPALVIVPPRIWHGVQNMGECNARVINLVDQAYRYATPDHWRIPADSPHVPFTFPAKA
ncbi:MAG TPA: hypothetical protein VM032_04135 [Vicinamibacterales bacterium]|nr:hypothetical protein [Vicinamibacterales bacterium]